MSDMTNVIGYLRFIFGKLQMTLNIPYTKLIYHLSIYLAGRQMSKL